MTTDAALVARTQDGDAEAFRALYERHRPAVERVCRKWLRDPYLVEDAVQESFVKAWTAMPGFEGGAELDRWLRRIARNHCHDIWRSLTRTEALGLAENPSVEHADPKSARLAGDCVDRLAVETMLRNLGRRDASLLVQRHIGDYSVGALAAQWGLTRGAMDVALHRARLRARRLASAEGLRGLLPVGLLRRAAAAMQRLSTTHADAGVLLVGVCNIAVAVSLSVPDVPPAYADEQVLQTASSSPSTPVLPARSLAATDRMVGADLPDRQVRRTQSSISTAAPGRTALSSTQPQSRTVVEADKPAESHVDFDPVTLPAGGTTISSKPRGRPTRSLVVEPARLEVEENKDSSMANQVKPVYDAACAAPETDDPLVYCED